LHQHETKRNSSRYPHDGFNESADIPFKRDALQFMLPAVNNLSQMKVHIVADFQEVSFNNGKMFSQQLEYNLYEHLRSLNQHDPAQNEPLKNNPRKGVILNQPDPNNLNHVAKARTPKC
jgi:hypothetical protein